MSRHFQEPVRQLLQELMEPCESELMMDMLENVNQSFTDGINAFLEKSGKKFQSKDPEKMKSYLRIYPMAQVLISIHKYYELNKDTEILENTISELLHSLEREHTEKTLH